MRRAMLTAVAIMLGLLMVWATVPVVAETRAVCVVHKGEWVWIRDRPSKDAEKIDTIRYGVEVEISDIRDGYAYITWLDGEKQGWADISYFDMPIKETIYVVASDGPLNKRETPDGRFLTRIKSGARVSVLGWRYSKKGELWAKTYHGGYVKASYLRAVDP